MLCPRDPLEVGRDAGHHIDNFAFVDIGRWHVHRLKHRVGHDGRTGNGKVGATSGKGHLGELRAISGVGGLCAQH